MALSQGEVDAFMAADKVVPERPMKWGTRKSGHRWWRGPLEVGGHRVGEVYFNANPALPRSWTFKTIFHGTEVYRLDVHSGPSGHCNTACPDDFPRKVRTAEHEHVYIEGLGCKCARPIAGIETASDPEVFALYCERTRLTFEPTYTSPFVYAQLQI